ncbi:MAG: GNAT family N-acetyltransferase [Thermomicrobiaceae bacterium]|nr:GNAT family N-acetyltransferase [Thermomicrobiaceae bacterium]
MEGDVVEGSGLEEPIVNIVGEKVALGPIRRDLVPLYQRWFNDFQMLRTLGMRPGPMSLEQEEAWYDRASRESADAVAFTIYERGSWRPIGTAGLHDIDFRNRTAEFGISIGDARARGRGYGTEVTRLVLDYAFTALGLNNVMRRVYEFNLAGRRAYEKAGFREIGRRREARYMGGRLWDEILMDCLASEFESPVLGEIFVPDVPRG